MSETLLPPNATAAERAMDMAAARIESVPAPARHMWNPDTCPASLLPWLAWAFSVDGWDPNWSEAQKRATIKASYSVHRRKGTVGAVRRALAALGLNVTIVEWWQQTPKGDPYTFKISITTNQGGATADDMAKVMDVVNAAKNIRSHLASVALEVNSVASMYFGAITNTGNEITVNWSATLTLNGEWDLDGSQKLNGIKE